MLISQTKLSGELVLERMAAYHRVDGFKSSAGWLSVHPDQLRPNAW